MNELLDKKILNYLLNKNNYLYYYNEENLKKIFKKDLKYLDKINTYIFKTGCLEKFNVISWLLEKYKLKELSKLNDKHKPFIIYKHLSRIYSGKISIKYYYKICEELNYRISFVDLIKNIPEYFRCRDTVEYTMFIELIEDFNNCVNIINFEINQNKNNTNDIIKYLVKKFPECYKSDKILNYLIDNSIDLNIEKLNEFDLIEKSIKIISSKKGFNFKLYYYRTFYNFFKNRKDEYSRIILNEIYDLTLNEMKNHINNYLNNSELEILDDILDLNFKISNYKEFVHWVEDKKIHPEYIVFENEKYSKYYKKYKKEEKEEKISSKDCLYNDEMETYLKGL